MATEETVSPDELTARTQFLQDRSLPPCPFHRQCCEDWGVVKIDDDVCTHERNRTIGGCPAITGEGDQRAYTPLTKGNN